MRRIFISYARENKRDVDQLVEHLGLMGYETWVDFKLRGGQEWWEEVVGRIASTDVFIAVLSHASLNSTACRREFDWAEALNKPVLPVAVEVLPPALPRRFALRQIIDYSQPEDRHRTALILQGGLATLPAAPPLPDPLPPAPDAPLSYLTELIDLITQADPITHAEQHRILQQLGGALRSVDPEELRGGRDILERFASRADLYADVDRAITGLRQVTVEEHHSLKQQPPPGPFNGPDQQPPQSVPSPASDYSGAAQGLPQTSNSADWVDALATDSRSAAPRPPSYLPAIPPNAPVPQWQPQGAEGTRFDHRKRSKLGAMMALVGGVFVVIASFFPWLTVKGCENLGVQCGGNAWDLGLSPTVSVVAFLIAAVFYVVFARQAVPPKVPLALIPLALVIVADILFLLTFFASYYSAGAYAGNDFGISRGWGLWVALAAIVVINAGAVMQFVKDRSQQGHGGGAPQSGDAPPPPIGYGPPAQQRGYPPQGGYPPPQSKPW